MQHASFNDVCATTARPTGTGASLRRQLCACVMASGGVKQGQTIKSDTLLLSYCYGCNMVHEPSRCGWLPSMLVALMQNHFNVKRRRGQVIVWQFVEWKTTGRLLPLGLRRIVIFHRDSMMYAYITWISTSTEHKGQ